MSHLISVQLDVLPGLLGELRALGEELTEDGLLKLIEYVKSLGAKNGTQNSATSLPVETSATPPAQQSTRPPAQGNR